MTNDTRVALASAVFALGSAVFTACQAHEAAKANDIAKTANKIALRASDEAKSANTTTRQAVLAQLERERRRFAQLAYVEGMKEVVSPENEGQMEEIVRENPGVSWFVVNLNTQGTIRRVYVTESTKDGAKVWHVGAVARCKAVGLRESRDRSPKYLHFVDENNDPWRRVSTAWWSTQGGWSMPLPDVDPLPPDDRKIPPRDAVTRDDAVGEITPTGCQAP